MRSPIRNGWTCGSTSTAGACRSGNTRTMIFSVAKVVSYVSQFMTLMPGDVITTGTPPGVGMGMKPPLFLKKGDVLTLGVQGLGTQRQLVVPFML
jgi:2,4-diketo-3-deoxy-L-fuconate hydrolase